MGIFGFPAGDSTSRCWGLKEAELPRQMLSAQCPPFPGKEPCPLPSTGTGRSKPEPGKARIPATTGDLLPIHLSLVPAACSLCTSPLINDTLCGRSHLLPTAAFMACHRKQHRPFIFPDGSSLGITFSLSCQRWLL